MQSKDHVHCSCNQLQPEPLIHSLNFPSLSQAIRSNASSTSSLHVFANTYKYGVQKPVNIPFVFLWPTYFLYGQLDFVYGQLCTFYMVNSNFLYGQLLLFIWSNLVFIRLTIYFLYGQLEFLNGQLFTFYGPLITYAASIPGHSWSFFGEAGGLWTKSFFYPWSAVFNQHFTLSLHLIPVCGLQSEICSLP